MTKRTYILVGILALLGGVLFWDQGSDISTSLAKVTSEEVAPASAMVSRIQYLKRFELARDQIEEAYLKIVPAYIERMASLGSYMDVKEDDKIFVESLIKQRLAAAGAIQDVQLTVGQSEQISEGVRRVRSELAFASGSDRDALVAVSTLGLPEHGMVWDDFLLVTDREHKMVKISGKISALIIEAAE